MAISSEGHSSFGTQANALLLKKLTFQKRNYKTNLRLVAFPFVLCLLLVLIQVLVDIELNKDKFKCGCRCIDKGDGTCENVCGIQYSTLTQVASCPIPNLPEWPALLQVPRPEFRAVRNDLTPFSDLPPESCRSTGSCKPVFLVTGLNQTLGLSLGENFYTGVSNSNGTDVLDILANSLAGSDTYTEGSNFIEPAFLSQRPLYIFQASCANFSTESLSINLSSIPIPQEVRCVEGSNLWRNSSSSVNDLLYKGYRQSNPERKINEIVAAYDFLNSNDNIFNVSIWYNSTYSNASGGGVDGMTRVLRAVNLASNAYLQHLKGAGVKMLLDFVKEMPKQGSKLTVDFSSLLGALFFSWVVLQLFPVVLTSLVYEKQQNLRIMMKMHGLGDGPYWVISYMYFLLLSVVYMTCFVAFGSLIRLKFFTLNDYSIQFVFYFIYVNLQISVAFLVATIFANVKTAAVIGHICVFGSGLLGGYLFQFFVEDDSFPRGWIIVLEIFPGFALYRGLYEFAQYALTGNTMGIDGMRWKDLSDGTNGMKEVLIIMLVEWLVVLCFAFYLDQVASSGSGVKKHPLYFLKNWNKKRSSSFRRPSLQRQDSKVFVEVDKPDVSQEREKVEQLLLDPQASHAIVVDNIKKVYPGTDGNPDKAAVRGLSLALPRGECFGMLGPNGAGKTSFISMMIGLTTPTSGMALVEGLDIRTDMDKIYTSMGVCPQHDLLWEILTGREHLMFYGRLKNLKGAALTQAVEESLKSVNLFHGGVGDKQAGKYSGGMKRRLSVAISLIGDPKVVYMDEPSTGLDPASRNNLWNVVKRAKENRAIILTTHSMEEAEVLCDRLGIFVDGSLQCVGNPKELKGRYGGSYVFTMTTSSNQDEEEVENLVRGLSPNANKIYNISGTQKFELPKQEVRIADVFAAVENAKRKFTINAWGLADTTLEDVFIKVARGAQAFQTLS
ncbi:ABC transporter A family member 7-like [Papaver somniferum]|uniref:ABC transporter A family member 7-like n=1 Tax=Papaver somniferum TaxID=3469 RepID=UPI000E70028C|nr:ABC transporter A family member 7-like [Papaver somniferum]